MESRPRHHVSEPQAENQPESGRRSVSSVASLGHWCVKRDEAGFRHLKAGSVCLGCSNETPKAGRLTQQKGSSSVPEAGVSSARCRQGRCLARPLPSLRTAVLAPFPHTSSRGFRVRGGLCGISSSSYEDIRVCQIRPHTLATSLTLKCLPTGRISKYSLWGL